MHNEFVRMYILYWMDQDVVSHLVVIVQTNAFVTDQADRHGTN